jgi:DNA-binding NarL/FixJ family response regulator
MRILLIDDHALFREGIALLLSRMQPEIETIGASSCEDAFNLLGDGKTVDLALMDLGLPGMSGLNGIAMLRERHPHIPIVALSSCDDRDTVLQALDNGAMGFIPKAATPEIMMAALRLVFARGIYLPPSVFLTERVASEQPNTVSATDHAQRRTTPAHLGLTQRQAEVLHLILQGKPAKLICRELALSNSTVKAHTSAVLRALNVTTRTQAVVAAGKLGLQFG